MGRKSRRKGARKAESAKPAEDEIEIYGLRLSGLKTLRSFNPIWLFFFAGGVALYAWGRGQDETYRQTYMAVGLLSATFGLLGAGRRPLTLPVLFMSLAAAGSFTFIFPTTEVRNAPLIIKFVGVVLFSGWFFIMTAPYLLAFGPLYGWLLPKVPGGPIGLIFIESEEGFVGGTVEQPPVPPAGADGTNAPEDGNADEKKNEPPDIPDLTA